MSAAANGSGTAAGSHDRLVEELVEYLRTRYYGLYRGIVTNNDDDQSLGRIKAQIPTVLGDVESGWCMPCAPYAGDQVGIAFLPDVGSAVWIAFEGGDVSYPVWVGSFWRSGELPSDVSPATKVIVTKAPLEVKLDDHGESAEITDSNGNKVTLDRNGITLSKGSQSLWDE